MKILIDIKNTKADFALEVLKNLSFVSEAKPISNAAVDLMDDLNQAVKDVKLHQQGKIKLKTAQQLLDEL